MKLTRDILYARSRSKTNHIKLHELAASHATHAARRAHATNLFIVFHFIPKILT